MKPAELTFYRKPELKENLLKQIKKHQRITSMTAYVIQDLENTLQKTAKLYGLPLWYLHVTEKIYEGLPEDEWLEFPYQAIDVLPVGISTDTIRSLWSYKLLESQLQYAKENKQVETAIRQCMELFQVPFNEINVKLAIKLAELAESMMWSMWSVEPTRLAELAKLVAELTWSVTRLTITGSAKSTGESTWTSVGISSNWQRDTLFSCIKMVSESTSSKPEISELIKTF
jgi:hypothetical protein